MKVESTKERSQEMCNAILDAIGEIIEPEDFAAALAGLNAATAALLARYSSDDAGGLENIEIIHTAILDLYRHNRNAMAEGQSPIGRTQ